MQGPTGLFVSFPAKKQRDSTHRQLAYPANAETRMLFQRVILAEYEKIVAGSVSNKVQRIRRHEKQASKLNSDYGVNLGGIVC